MIQVKHSQDNWHQLSANEATQQLGVDPILGLSSDEAGVRRQRYGPNRLKEIPPRSHWLLLLDQFKGFLILVLIGTAAKTNLSKVK